MKRVALIKPANDVSMYNIIKMPLLGLLTLGAILKKKGYEVRVYSDSKALVIKQLSSNGI